MSEKPTWKITIDPTVCFIFILIILFWGDPDLLDGIIYWLSDGNLKPK
jgi:hypothetical protein